jgi:transcription elongation factor SPT6
VTGKVVRNGDFGSRVKLEGEIPAFIPLRNLSDEHVETAEDIVAAGQIVTAVITMVKKEHMTVDMSLKMEDFRKNPSSWERPLSLPPIDVHFDLVAAAKIEEDNNKRREAHLEALQLSLGTKGADGEEGTGQRKRIGRVARRACTHPAFRNAKTDEITRELKEGGAAMVGEALIRPSSKNSDALAIHWVVKEGSIKVVEVIEEDKETEASIGNTLKVKVSRS